jgi:ribosomal protein L21E
MEHNKAPGPDEFLAEFYQACWEIIKNDLMTLFQEFHNGDLPLYSLNFDKIILLPKCREAVKIQQYRPISLLNVSFKIFTKVVTNRVTQVAQKVISPSQTTFLLGRNIMEGVIVLHETIHEMHRKKQDGLIFKVDFEKAYDKINWSFVQQTLRMKGFSPKWRKWIQSFMEGDHVGVKINDQVKKNFQTKKGFDRGSLSSILFNIVGDMLAILIKRAKIEGQIAGVIPHLVDDGLSILQYVDDTILFMEHDLEKAKNMKLLLSAFKQLSGLKINFHKSKIFCFDQVKEYESQYEQLFGCKKGSCPFKYLRLPMHYRKLSNKDWEIIEERIEKKLSSWKGKYISVGGRLVLINSVLSRLPMFMLSFFKIPKGVLKKIDYFRSRFFWQQYNQKRKHRLTKWNIICQPKDQGGLGIQNLEIQNQCLLSKWLFKLINEEGLWQTIICNKYLSSKTIGKVERKSGDSHFWTWLIKAKDAFLAHGSFCLKNGKQIHFWEDK